MLKSSSFDFFSKNKNLVKEKIIESSGIPTFYLVEMKIFKINKLLNRHVWKLPRYYYYNKHYLTLVLLTLVRVVGIIGKKKEQQLVPNHKASKTILWAVVLKVPTSEKL
jgi:hypothetical protein